MREDVFVGLWEYDGKFLWVYEVFCGQYVSYRVLQDYGEAGFLYGVFGCEPGTDRRRYERAGGIAYGWAAYEFRRRQERGCTGGAWRPHEFWFREDDSFGEWKSGICW